MKIKVKEIVKGCAPTIMEQGDWFDLKTADTIVFTGPRAATLKRNRPKNEEETSFRVVDFDFKLINLGFAMQLPKGFEAVMVPRSSLYKKLGIIQTNSMGIIDNSYCGNNDEWKFPALAFKNTTIEKGTRICQFKIQLSQKASIWQKIKWLFDNKIEFKLVEDLENEDRGGIGSTGYDR